MYRRGRIVSRPNQRPSIPLGDLKQRLLRIAYEWPTGSTLILEAIMFLFGLIFLTQPLHHTIPPSSPWLRWGNGGLFVIGIIFTVLGAYGALYRERQTGLIPTFVLVVLGLLTSVHPLNLIGFAFYLPFLVGGIVDGYRRYERAHLSEKKYLIYVPKPEEDGDGDD